MLVSDVTNAASADIRQVLSATGTDASLLIGWVDQIHKNALHTSLYNYLLKGMATFQTTVNTPTYTVSTNSDIPRRLLMVYDRTFERLILPIENIVAPTSTSEDIPAQPIQTPRAMISAATSEQWPEYFYRIGNSGSNISLVLFPAPQKTAFLGTYEAYYEKQVADLVNLTDSLVIPDDGLDLMVAGVNMRASAYMKLTDDLGFWSQQYEQLKHGIAI